MVEEWKDIPGYEGLYQASTAGRVRTCEGKTTSSARFKVRVWKQRIMKQKITANSKGRKDCRVELWKNGKHKTYLVSRLVAMTWCNGYSDQLTVNHIDGNPLNNSYLNLEWVSKTENIKHGFENGLYHKQKRCGLKRSDGNILFYRSQAQASRHIGRTNNYISGCIKHGRNAVSKSGETYEIVI